MGKTGGLGQPATQIDPKGYMKNQFPELLLMASDLLSIPISAIAFESTFSTGGKIFTRYHSCLLPENVEALISTQTWLYGFNCSI